VDIAAIEAAWSAFFDNNSSKTKDQLREEGWKTRDDLLKLKMGWRDIRDAVEAEKLEKKIFRVKCDKLNRDVALYRPKL
jgi:hypothetical protein